MNGLAQFAVAAIAGLSTLTLLSLVTREAEARILLMPRALLRFASLLVPRPLRGSLLEDWQADLAVTVRETDGGPVSQLIVGLLFAVPFIGTGRRIAREVGSIRVPSIEAIPTEAKANAPGLSLRELRQRGHQQVRVGGRIYVLEHRLFGTGYDLEEVALLLRRLHIRWTEDPSSIDDHDVTTESLTLVPGGLWEDQVEKLLAAILATSRHARRDVLPHSITRVTRRRLDASTSPDEYDLEGYPITLANRLR